MACQVFVSIGSNIDRHRKVRGALDALAGRFAPLSISSVYENAAQGFRGEPFYNLVVGFRCNWSAANLRCFLRRLEHRQGRVRGAHKFVSRTLDLDLLSYGERPRRLRGLPAPSEEILHYDFVLTPLVEIAATHRHPVLRLPYRTLWRQRGAPRLAMTPFYWRRQRISPCRNRRGAYLPHAAAAAVRGAP